MRRSGAFLALLLLLCGIVCGVVRAQPSAVPPVDADTLVTGLLHTAAAAPCTPDADSLVRVLCAGRLRVGVRSDYARFGIAQDGQFTGYEPELARRIAARLGLAVAFVPVTAATRISALGEDKVDLVIATMGHTAQRDTQVTFIRPHYYASDTVVVGARPLAVAGWEGLAGNTVCVTLGASSNQDLVAHNVRLLLFDTPRRLLEELERGACPLIAQDDSLLAASFADPAFARRYDTKFEFDTLPWGMAVPLHDSAGLARVLSLLSQQFHRDGTFLSLARQAGIGLGFLERQQVVWRGADCRSGPVAANPACLLPPQDSSLARLAYADKAERLEAWVHDRTGLVISLPMFKTVVAFQLFVNGLISTVILIAGAMAFTTGFAILFGAAIWSRHRVLAPAVHTLTVLLRSSPIVLLLFVGFTVATALASYSLGMALAVAMVVLGLFNGSYAAQSIVEIRESLRHECHGEPPGWRLLAARSAVQMTSFLVNATKGSAAASMIGAPELLGALTDISSISSERVTLYSLLMLCYLLLVLLVMALCAGLRRWLERGPAARHDRPGHDRPDGVRADPAARCRDEFRDRRPGLGGGAAGRGAACLGPAARRRRGRARHGHHRGAACGADLRRDVLPCQRHPRRMARVWPRCAVFRPRRGGGVPSGLLHGVCGR